MERNKKLVQESLPQQDWFGGGDTEAYIDFFTKTAETQIKLIPGVIRVQLEDFIEEPNSLFNTLRKLGIPESGIGYMYEKFDIFI